MQLSISDVPMIVFLQVNFKFYLVYDQVYPELA